MPRFFDPIVEYAEVDCIEHDGGGHSVFDDMALKDHPYYGPIFKNLKKCKGTYLFYDSQARPLYLGKAEKQSIWTRANQSYVSIKSRQDIRVVQHPTNKKAFAERHRVSRIKTRPYALWELATYFSAYHVPSEYIGQLEAFGIRAFANVLMNTKMEGKSPLFEPLEVE